MRAFAPGDHFHHVEASHFIPDDGCLEEMEDDVEQVRALTVFSEGYLYPRLGKSDARFVLAVADEYERLICILGVEKVRELLREK